ncbi:hypothetical protein TrCOL_g7090 [Triparma columacea]|uniref:PAS domain-containing protein n=1 Tax=Triparma columacea TaxID=722753 RepID=A0A9W7GFD8_9STRA|nr:hypothetical protein TrCOL_g7090 [Triparma columacea]
MEMTRNGTARSTVGGRSGVVMNPVGSKGSAREQQYELHSLEQHVAQLTRANQPIALAITQRLEELRVKEQKRTAKRAANRKSACTSRARKKALVDSITFENQRLQKLSAILEKVPDMIFSVGKAGKIEYVNERVTQVLGFDTYSLINGDFYSLLVPPSRPLILRLVGGESSPSSQKGNIVSTGASSSISSARSTSPSEGEDSNDSGAQGGGGGGAGGGSKKQQGNSATSSSRNHQSSNEGGSDSSREANSNSLARNVNLFNAKLFPPSGKRGEVDDVNGEGVTANNKTARLSSLEYNNGGDPTGALTNQTQGQGANQGKDSNSRDNSEGSDSFPTRSESSENGNEKDGERRSVRVCMVRKDLTTVWCEAVFSREQGGQGQGGDNGSDDAASSEKASQSTSSNSSSPYSPFISEIIFSLRPLRDGERVGVELAYKPPPPPPALLGANSFYSEDGSSTPNSNGSAGQGSTANNRGGTRGRGKRGAEGGGTGTAGNYEGGGNRNSKRSRGTVRGRSDMVNNLSHERAGNTRGIIRGTGTNIMEDEDIGVKEESVVLGLLGLHQNE